jgi:triacylglycerol esterase/lipase EstA (alpha/beta hydrolase family)
MLTSISKASTLLRIVVGIQFCIALLLAQTIVGIKGKPMAGDGEWLALFVTTGIVFFAIRFVIVALQFGISFIAGSPTPLAHRIGVLGGLRTFWKEATASLSAFVWRMPFLPNIAMHQPDQSSKTLAVLMVHGYGCNRAMWLKFSRGLARSGYASEAINLEPPLGSIDDYPAQIEAGVSVLMAKVNVTHIAIVAHSMGGLACRAYLNAATLEHNKRIFKVITLGTPHQGTVHASLGQGQNTRQMRRKSQWREALEGRERTEDVAKFVCIMTHHDNIVAPQAMQTVIGAKTIELHGIGHVALAYSDEVLQLVINELQDLSQSI